MRGYARMDFYIYSCYVEQILLLLLSYRYNNMLEQRAFSLIQHAMNMYDWYYG